MFDIVLTVGERYDIKVAGAYAMETLRMERSYPLWGQDLDTGTTPWEARLGSNVDMEKVTMHVLYNGLIEWS